MGGGAKSSSASGFKGFWGTSFRCGATILRKNKKFAFTLAEVLITLGIIGVVAAMTMPTLIQKYQKKATAVRIKKAYSMIYQAVKLSEAENGNFNEWDIGSGTSIENTRKFVQTYIAPYIKGLRECSSGSSDLSCAYPVSMNGVNYLINNGEGISIVAYQHGSIVSSKLFDSNAGIFLLYDLHPGKGKKSVLGKDYFYFVIRDGKLLPFGYTPGITRDDILTGKVQIKDKEFISCKKDSVERQDGYEESYRHGCTALLYIDDWEFKDDYPW